MTFVSMGLAYIFFLLVKIIFAILVLFFFLLFIVQKIKNYYDSSIRVDLRKILNTFYKSIKYGVFFPLLFTFCFILFNVPSMYKACEFVLSFLMACKQAGFLLLR